MTTSTEKTVNSDRYIGNLLLPIAIFLMAAVFYVQTLEFPAGEDVGPAVVPHLWMVFTTLFCASLVFQASTKRLAPDPVAGKIGFVALFVVALIAYVLAIETIGYFVSTLVFLSASMYAMSYRNLKIIISVTIGWLIFAYVIFVKLLFIPLPIGPVLEPILGM